MTEDVRWRSEQDAVRQADREIPGAMEPTADRSSQPIGQEVDADRRTRPHAYEQRIDESRGLGVEDEER